MGEDSDAARNLGTADTNVPKIPNIPNILKIPKKILYLIFAIPIISANTPAAVTAAPAP